MEQEEAKEKPQRTVRFIDEEVQDSDKPKDTQSDSNQTSSGFDLK
jgi:hypothetical protein